MPASIPAQPSGRTWWHYHAPSGDWSNFLWHTKQQGTGDPVPLDLVPRQTMTLLSAGATVLCCTVPSAGTSRAPAPALHWSIYLEDNSFYWNMVTRWKPALIWDTASVHKKQQYICSISKCAVWTVCPENNSLLYLKLWKGERTLLLEPQNFYTNKSGSLVQFQMHTQNYI
jgi:hypothetical protein